MDPNWETTRLVTGGADFTVRIWDIETGKNVSIIDDKNGGLTTSAKSVNFSYCGNLVGKTFCSDKIFFVLFKSSHLVLR